MTAGRFVALLFFTAMPVERISADMLILRTGQVHRNVDVKIRGGKVYVTTRNRRVHVYDMRAVHRVRFNRRSVRKVRSRKPSPRNRQGEKFRLPKTLNAAVGAPVVNSVGLKPRASSILNPENGGRDSLNPAWALNPLFSPLLFSEWKGLWLTLGKMLVSYRLHAYMRAPTLLERNQKLIPGFNELSFVMLAGPGILPSLGFLSERLRNNYFDPDKEGELVSGRLMRRKIIGATLLLGGLMALDYRFTSNRHARKAIVVSARRNEPGLNLRAEFKF